MIDPLSYINGLCVAFYFLACLLCGLQLLFNVLHIHTSSDATLSRMVGIVFLLMSCEGLCYILYDINRSIEYFWMVGIIVDGIMFAAVACLTHVLFSNNQPSIRVMVALSVPFLALTISFILLPPIRKFSPLIGISFLIAVFIHYGISIRKRERSLDDIYSNPDSHSLYWVHSIIGLLAGWMAIHYYFIISGNYDYYNITLYLYLTLVVLFVFVKVSNYGEPVSRETQKQIENAKWNEVTASMGALQEGLNRLFNDEEIFLNHNLTIENAAARLDTTPLFLSAMIHNNMHTTFSRLINQHRIEKAKVLLTTTDDKIEYIANFCGFNSTQVFNRTFNKYADVTPSQWRKSHTSKD